MVYQLNRILVFVAMASVASFADAGVLLSGPNLQFGDFSVYSMALLQFNEDGSTSDFGSKKKFYIESSPGKLKDDIVIATGLKGQVWNNQDITPGFDDIDNAFQTPNKPDNDTTNLPYYNFVGQETIPDFSVASATSSGADMTDSWEANAGAISSVLGGEDLVFWFNLNETGTKSQLDGQDLLVWAEVKLFDGNGADTGHVFYLSDGPVTAPTVGGRSDWGYVHSEITVDPTTGLLVHLGPPTAADILAGYVAIKQNLGADNAAFGAFNQELHDLVKANPTWTLSAKLELGYTNNGYEQVFIRGANVAGIGAVPEPASLMIWGWVALIGLKPRYRKTQTLVNV